jgi:hypothetical protein
MAAIRTVKLELLRAGPSHNQLLSPLTPYVALCGSDGPVTVNLPFEHRQLLARLERLRYESKGQSISNRQRESEVREIGETLGQVLGEVPTLISEIALARCGGALIHLTLSMSALELGMVPFEFTIGADGFPASGSPLFLQSQSPITITREFRRGKPLPVTWDRPPRILFVYASPDGLPNVPAENHLRALRRAMDPWVKWYPDKQKRCEEVEKLITVLPDANLRAISEACDKTEFTHVHILAHGAEFEQAGDSHYGVALYSDNGLGKNVVDGERLAIALITTDSSGKIRHRPNLISLATCDSGNINSPITPGGSIAHELHASGIPWVVASQFPLHMHSSTLAVEILYKGLLKGLDPRWLIYELRQRLFAHCNDTHDWASIVAYATVPENFEHQVAAFRDHQRRREIEVKFHIADQYLKSISDNKLPSGTSNDKLPGGTPNNKLPERYESLERLYESIRTEHQNWLEELDDDTPPSQRAEVFGMFAAAEKRIGLLYEAQSNTDIDTDQENTRKSFKKACKYYKQAMETAPGNHWGMTQYLSMRAILELDKDSNLFLKELHELWVTAVYIAKWASTFDKKAKADALASLAELELLGSVYAFPEAFNLNVSKDRIAELCRELIDTAGSDAFIVRATLRQFLRYEKAKSWHCPKWSDLATSAVKILEQETM